MRVDLVVPPKAAAGQPVPITLRIANTGKRPIELHLQGRTITFDVIVEQSGAVVWRRLEGATVPAILQIRVLGPGEVIELKDVWRQTDATGGQVAPGDYTVRGSVPTDGKPLRTAAVALRITE
ncbi:MAG TPA: BsuPI-related putative proteinase inhibitor [Gemmatimonadales bacterium]|nr:BsuPI-related putative proteinase inhibitor [Gemmatimonadales bacterium]